MSRLIQKLTYAFPIAAGAFLLLVFFEYLRVSAAPAPAPAAGSRRAALSDDRRMTKRDRLFCLLITALYAVTAFVNLGDTKGIETFCRFTERGQYALIEFPEPVYIGAVRFYPGLFMGGYNLQFSEDGEDFRSVASLKQNHAALFKWKDAELSEEWGQPVRFLRLVAGSQLWLGELAVYDDEGALIPTEDMVIPAGCAKLFDEQDKIPAAYSYRNGTYFDEIYHARTAYEHIQNIYPYEISHPPLGKLLLGIGIRLFGMVPFGWRFMGTLFGVAMLPAMYLILKKMLGGTLVPVCGTVVFATDFMHFVQTRIATIDTYEVLFILLMYGFFWCYWAAPRDRRRDWLPALALSGVSFGLGAASKWTGFYAGAGLAVLWLIDRIARLRAGYRAGKRAAAWRETGENVLWCLLLFVLVPAVIYYLSYWYYGTSKGLSGPGMLFSKDYLRIVLDNQKYMFNYHSGVTATHHYSSVWWQWVLDIRPILYLLEYSPDNAYESSIGCWLNPLLCWGGLLAMVCMVYEAAAERDRAALFILIGYLAQLVPWLFVKRVVFEYHYFPSSVFLVLALGHIFRTIERKEPKSRYLAVSFAAVSAVLFAVFYPALSGLTVPRWYDLKLLKWLPTWPF